MKVEQMLLLPVTLTIVQISDSLAVSIMNDPVTPCCSPSASVENSSDSKDKGTLDFFECFVKEWNSNYSECYDVFLSYWNSGETTENSRDDKIEERKKTKISPWNFETLFSELEVKMFLLIPILAFLAGKAIFLSLLSSLIIALTFFNNSQNG